MEIEHLGYRVKSDDNTFELTLKIKRSINDDDVHKKIEDFFDTFSVKVNVVTLVKVAQEEKKSLDEKGYIQDQDMPSLEKRQFIIMHYLPHKFTIRDYLDYYMGQGRKDEKSFKTNFYSTVQPLLEEGRVKNTGHRKGRMVIYEKIMIEENEGQPGDANDVLILER